MMTMEQAVGNAAGPNVAVRGYEVESSFRDGALGEVKRSFRDEALAEFDMLYRIAVQLTPDRPSSKRLLQEAVLTAYRSWEDRDDNVEPRVWIAQVLVREHRRLFDVDEEAEDERADRWAPAASFLNEAFMDGPARAAVTKNLRPAVIRRATRHLPLSARRVRALSSIADFSYNELASVLDSTMGEVKKRLFAARELLKWRLATDMNGALRRDESPS